LDRLQFEKNIVRAANSRKIPKPLPNPQKIKNKNRPDNILKQILLQPLTTATPTPTPFPLNAIKRRMHENNIKNLHIKQTRQTRIIR